MKLLVLAIMATFTLSVGAQQSPEFECEREGFFAKPGNCKLIYECEKQGAKYSIDKFRCPNELLFDKAKNTCVFWTTTNCTHSTNESPGFAMIDKSIMETFFDKYNTFKIKGFSGQPGSCQYYINWEWSSGNPYRLNFLKLYKCPPGTLFHPMYLRCNKNSPCNGNPNVEISEALLGTTEELEKTTLLHEMINNIRFFAKADNCKYFYSWKGIKGTNDMSDSIELKLMQCPKGYRFIETARKCLKEDQDGYTACKINPFDDYSGAELLEEDNELVQK